MIFGIESSPGKVKGGVMNEYINSISTEMPDENNHKAVISNLYNLIEAIEDELEPEERYIAPYIVADLLKTGKVKLVCREPDCRQFLN